MYMMAKFSPQQTKDIDNPKLVNTANIETP